MISMSTNVFNAARYLDEHYPGWYREVDLTTFDISSCTKCIIGQVFHTETNDPTYTKILRVLCPDFWGDGDYRMLKRQEFNTWAFTSNEATQYWAREVQQRRATSPPLHTYAGQERAQELAMGVVGG
jgi:hypothetical protein